VQSGQKIDKQTIINDFVEKAKQKETIEYRTEELVDFSGMTDEQIGQWLVGEANLIDNDNDKIKSKYVRKEYNEFKKREKRNEESDYYMDLAWDELVNWYLTGGEEDDLDDLDESKFSSFKDQQTITENFRRFLKNTSNF
jgi:hypothetical protein